MMDCINVAVCGGGDTLKVIQKLRSYFQNEMPEQKLFSPKSNNLQL